MISLRGVSHVLGNGREILSGADLDIPDGHRVAMLGRQSSGKSTVLSLLAGNVAPHRGSIKRDSKVSYVAGFQGGFRVTQTVRQNIVFAARAYGADPFAVFDFVEEVTGFGAALDMPMRQLSLLNRNNLSYVLAYALPFDVYLFDNVIGPVLSEIPNFSLICHEMYDRRMAEAGCIIATRNVYVAQKYCDCAVLLRGGRLEFHDDLRKAVSIFNNDLMVADELPKFTNWTTAPTEDDDVIDDF